MLSALRFLDRYEYDSDEEEYDYGSQEESDNAEDDVAIEIENAYYEADDIKGDEPSRALELFEKCVRLENEEEAKDGGVEVKWRFKALQHIVVLQYRLGNLDAMASQYETMLNNLGSVTHNERLDAINEVLEAISKATNADIVSKIFNLTLSSLKKSKNDRLWFQTKIKQAKLYLALQQWPRLEKLIGELTRACHTRPAKPGGGGSATTDAAKESMLLEVYGLEIQFCQATGRGTRLRSIYRNAMKLGTAIQDPRVMGAIHECGGKLFLEERKWDEAYNEFYCGFRAYQESGNARARVSLKYAVLANMLSLSAINPFDSREAKVYKDVPEIKAMLDLRRAYESDDIKLLEKTLNDPRTNILGDATISKYVAPLLRTIRAHVILQLVRPYRRVRIRFLSEQINMPVNEVESLLVELILDARLKAKIDQVDGFVHMEGVAGGAGSGGRTAAPELSEQDKKKFNAIATWTKNLEALGKAMGIGKVGAGGGMGGMMGGGGGGGGHRQHSKYMSFGNF